MIDWEKLIETRNGRKVRVLCRDRKSERYPVVALVGERADIISYTEDGVHNANAGTEDLDLVNVPEPIVRYFNIYSGDLVSVCLHKSREGADSAAEYATKPRIGRIRVDFGDGKRFDE